ncbi:MAG TPA: four-carbon acid sugar kinase family protein [Spirochaetales bacterium]|nr:four-carbon acid sugar kinase family protein [Spirochaetales bacterium]
MTLDEAVKGKPPVRHDLKNRMEIRKALSDTQSKLVVDDDDPTGTQTVHGIWVYMDWSVDTMKRALTQKEEVFYISTNSRALPKREMEILSRDLGRNLREASQAISQDSTQRHAQNVSPHMLIASRSDSTLRGHFPEEVDALLEGLEQTVDGIILAPALFEAGRYTIDDIHWVEQGGTLVPAADTEFARDPAFGYTHSNLREWVEEKTRGRWKAEEVLTLSLERIRGEGPEGVLTILMEAIGGVPIIVNAACYEDLETVVLAILEAEKRGKRYAYRSAACFIKVRGGFTEKPLLTASELGTSGGAGLIVVGSYVGKTSRQLDRLLAEDLCQGIELQVDLLTEGEVKRVKEEAEKLLKRGKTVAIYTSRKVRQAQGKEFLSFGNRVMESLCRVVQEIQIRPAFVVAKGGITSVEIARTGLGVKEAYVPGQIAKGVPLWQLGPETKWPGIPYVVFPGNVGDDETLKEVVHRLRTPDESTGVRNS